MFRNALMVLLGLMMWFAAAPARAAPLLDPVRVQAYVDGLMRQAMDTHDTPGATVSIVQNGRVIMAKGYGIARIAPQTRMVDTDTIFQIASISKTPTYIAVMQLVEAGKISLDDPVNRHLPAALHVPDQGFAQPIRIRHLLTHSAGFDDSALGHIFVNRADQLLPLTAYLRTYRVNRVREPGVQSAYSNYSVSLLGGVIEHVSGLYFATYVDARIFRPLGMKTATFRSTGLPDNRADLIKGSIGNWSNELPEFSTGMPAGSMRASANDMAAYALALAEPARLEAAGVLKRETLAAMLAPTGALPGMPHLGFRPKALVGGRRGFGHGGSMLSGASDLVIIPDLGVGIFISTNGDGGHAFVDQVAQRIVDSVAPLPEQAPLRTAQIVAAAKAVAGDWIANRRNMTMTERSIMNFSSSFTLSAEAGGDLIMSTITGATTRYQPVAADMWQNPKTLIAITHRPDVNGTPVLWWGDGSGSAVRARWFERPLIITAVLVLTLIVALGTCIAALSVRKKPLSLRLGEAAAAAWLIGIAGFAWTLTSGIPDRGAALVFGYPGWVVAFTWIIAAAVALTAASLILAPRLFSGSGWSFGQKARHAGRLAIFTVSGLLCWQIGLVGYSGY